MADILDNPVSTAIMNAMRRQTKRNEPPEVALARRDEWNQQYRDTMTAVNEFWQEMKDEFQWDFLPYKFLEDLYVAWCKRTLRWNFCPDSDIFIAMLHHALDVNGCWCGVADTTVTPPEYDFCVVPTGVMDRPEPLVLSYNLQQKWGNSKYTGADPAVKCTPAKLASCYRGLVRRGVEYQRYKRGTILKCD